MIECVNRVNRVNCCISLIDENHWILDSSIQNTYDIYSKFLLL